MCSLQCWSWDQWPVMLIKGSISQWCCSGNNSDVDRGINGQWCWSRDQRANGVVRGNNSDVDRGINGLWCWSRDQRPRMLFKGTTNQRQCWSMNQPTAMLIYGSTNKDVDRGISQQWCWSKDQPVNSVVDCGINKSKVLLINRSTKDKYCWSRDQQNEGVDRVVGLNNKSENEEPVLRGWKWMKFGKFQIPISSKQEVAS